MVNAPDPFGLEGIVLPYPLPSRAARCLWPLHRPPASVAHKELMLCEAYNSCPRIPGCAASDINLIYLFRYPYPILFAIISR